MAVGTALTLQALANNCGLSVQPTGAGLQGSQDDGSYEGSGCLQPPHSHYYDVITYSFVPPSNISQTSHLKVSF